jgi:ATP-binding cassette subfamily C protein
LAGTVAENIARFNPEAEHASIIKAAKAADAHDLIVDLPNGYDTEIGENGTILSAGQRQRIALARALFGDPFVLVLDEPNANLDSEGEAALTEAILRVKSRGGIVVIITHRPAILGAVDFVMVLQQGCVSALGPRDEVLARWRRALPPAATARKAPFSIVQ